MLHLEKVQVEGTQGHTLVVFLKYNSPHYAADFNLDRNSRGWDIRCFLKYVSFISSTCIGPGEISAHNATSCTQHLVVPPAGGEMAGGEGPCPGWGGQMKSGEEM